jgi:hypothetical protein
MLFLLILGEAKYGQSPRAGWFSCFKGRGFVSRPTIGSEDIAGGEFGWGGTSVK